jgi:hypothetical protein
MTEEMTEEERQKEIARLTELLERPKKANLINRAIYKWVLELLRNCMVVAALFLIATKSGDWWLYGIAGLGGLALTGYCHTYVENVWLAIDFPQTTPFKKHAMILGGVLLLNVVLGAITVGLYVSVDRIVKAQSQTAKAP